MKSKKLFKNHEVNKNSDAFLILKCIKQKLWMASHADEVPAFALCLCL